MMPNTAREQLLSDLSLETQFVQRRVKAALPLIEAAAPFRDALIVASDIIDANVAEDICRHGTGVFDCPEPEGCADRSRREQIREALGDA